MIVFCYLFNIYICDLLTVFFYLYYDILVIYCNSIFYLYLTLFNHVQNFYNESNYIVNIHN